MTRFAALSAALVSAALVAAPARAVAGPIVTFNTGVDAAGNVLPDGTVGDLHYALISAPAGSTTALRVRTSAGGYPIPPYLGDNALSRWVGPNNDPRIDGPAGTYIYRTTFDLTGFDPATARIAGRWSSDNEGLQIRLNGASIGTPPTPAQAYRNFYAFSAASGFVSGLNTLDFVVNQDGGTPTALRVELSGTASPVPAPAGLVLAAAGAVGSAGFARLRRRTPAAS